MTRSQTTTTRRSVLKGVGASLALPWLPSLSWAETGRELPGLPPRRWCTLLFANGIDPATWWAQQGDAGVEIGPSLEVLRPHLHNCLFLENLHLFDDTQGVHFPYFTNFLAGETIRKGNLPDVAESLDQYLGRSIGRATALPTLNLALEPLQHGLRSGVPSVYFGTISWSSTTTPVPPEIYPRQAFDRLFDQSGLLRRRSVLDAVAGHARDLRGKLSWRDQHKLDEFMQSVRDLEQRIERAVESDRPAGWRPALSEPDLDRPEDGIPSTVPEHMRLMNDILILALQMDKTRVATLLYNNDGTYDMSFEFLDGVSGESMHVISHHGNEQRKLADYRMINRYHAGQLAYVMARMADIDEGNGSLLDNTMLLFGSSMGDGNRHDANHLPLILASGRNCDITSNRVLSYENLEDRRLCNLHLACAQRMGCGIDRFGNSHYPLPGLSG